MNRTHAARSSRRSIPVYREVYQRIRSEILSGRLAAGARLPSSRTLAAELGIARGTVVTAFQMLAGEGYTGVGVDPVWWTPFRLRRRCINAEESPTLCAGIPATDG
jgi:DNA-binding transcriptional MocR family regulator